MKAAAAETPVLNDDQRRAVEHPPEPLLILGPPGSGKTRTMTHRIARLIQRGDHAAEDILAVTFTNKAADEMKERVLRKLNRDPEDPAPVLKTFHALGAFILRREAGRTGTVMDRNEEFTIYDADDTAGALEAAAKNAVEDRKLQVDEDELDDLIDSADYWRETAKNYGEGPIDYFLMKSAGQGPDPNPQIEIILEYYESFLRDVNAFDFGDLLQKPLAYFDANPERESVWASRYDHVLVDEFQDTNDAQFQLMNRLVGSDPGVSVVGDDDQCIYTWRGANPENLLDGFERVFDDPEVVRLTRNYRSYDPIVETSKSLIKTNEKRKTKPLNGQRGNGPSPTAHSLWRDEDEARFIVNTIEGFVDNGRYEYEDMAVLFRTNHQTRELEQKCIAHGIPYTIVGGFGFFDRKEIKDIMAYVKTIANPQMDQSFRRIINTPKRSIGPSTMEEVEAVSRDWGIPLKAALYTIDDGGVEVSTRKYKAITGAARLFRKLDGLDGTPAHILEQIIEITQYKTFLKKQYQNEDGGGSYEDRVENLEELISMATKIDSQTDEPLSLTGFINEVALYTDVDETDPEDEAGVNIMTIHAAKGLEFPVVFVPGLEEDVLPHERSMNADRLIEQEEERRLCYVAFTRAEDRLIPSFARKRMIHGDYQNQDPSRFIENAGLDVKKHE